MRTLSAITKKLLGKIVGQGLCSCRLTDIGNIVEFANLSERFYRININTNGRKIWQFRYYDHIILNEFDYQTIWKYIDENPAKWKNDKYYCDMC